MRFNLRNWKMSGLPCPTAEDQPPGPVQCH